jgi:transposase-like protein
LFVEPGLLAGLITSAVQAALEEQVCAHLGAQAYERTLERSGHRNGYKSRTMKTAVGRLEFAVPQVREGGFRPTAFELYQRSDKALVSTMQEMVVRGVSTREVGSVLETMAGFEVSAATVSRAMGELDEEIRAFRERSLGGCEWPYLIIDARYEKVRNKAGKVVKQAVLVVAGITDEGRREILGYAAGDSESEATWGGVFADLKRRGLGGVEIVVSDAHRGIQAALGKHFQGVLWQRCRVHLMREMLKKVSWGDYKELSADLRAIFVGEDRQRCLDVAQEVAEKWQSRAPKMSAALLAGIEDCLTVQDLPRELRRRLHSTNMLERLMRTLKTRTRKVVIFPNAAACERLIGALLIETHEEWQTEERRYLNLDRKD